LTIPDGTLNKTKLARDWNWLCDNFQYAQLSGKNMKRRDFVIMSSLAIMSTKIAAATFRLSEPANERLFLWMGVAPGGGGPRGPEITDAKGAVTNVAQPSLEIFIPKRPNAKSVLIAAGGGYKRIEQGMEAIPAAQWLRERGYTAYVLTYRLPGEGWNNGSLVSLQDAQRALRIIRSREQYVSVLGFSAGGHLLGMAVNQADRPSYNPTDQLDSISPQAEGAALVYPIITLEKPYSHTSTHKMLLGNHADPEEESRWSLQNMVNRHTPPMFLVQAEDDPISNPENTLIMKSACDRAKVPAELYRYSSGGHGFGMGRAGTPTVDWPGKYEAWLARK